MHVDFAFWAKSFEINPDGTMNVLSLGVPTIYFAKLPSSLQSLSFFAYVTFADTDRGESYPLQATVIGPNGKPVVSMEIRIKRDDDAMAKTPPVTFARLPIDREGTYRARFEAGGERREWPFRVVLGLPEVSSQSPVLPREQSEGD